jgi:carbamate kinase
MCRRLLSRSPRQGQARRIARIGAETLSSDQFAAGSTRTKCAAAARFASQTGNAAAVGSLEDAEPMLLGESGTLIEAGTVEVHCHD